MTIPLHELIENPSDSLVEPTFMGIGIGPDGVPIDLARVHLLGESLKNYTVLVADEFSSDRLVGESGLNDLDLQQALNKYYSAFDCFDEIWPNGNNILRASEIMNDPRFQGIYDEIETRIKGTKLEQEIHEIQTERGDNERDMWKFAVSELAVIEFLSRTEGVNIKLGPHGEIKYDSVMGKLSPDMRFYYLHSSRGLTNGNEPSPYSVANIQSIGNRILISDEPDTVEEKLRLTTIEAQRYFANLGSLARMAAGHTKHIPSREEIHEMSLEEVQEFAQDSIVGNIIAPFRRAQGISVYGETPMRKIYDQTLERAKFLLRGRVPNLAEIVRPELDSIGKQLLYLLSERSEFNFDPEVYDAKYPHLVDARVLKEIPSAVYAPMLQNLNIKGQKTELPVGIDLEIMGLLQRRLETSYHVAVAKLKIGKSVYDGVREQAVIQGMMNNSARYSNLDPKNINTATRSIMDSSKEIQDIIISRFSLDFEDKLK